MKMPGKAAIFYRDMALDRITIYIKRCCYLKEIFSAKIVYETNFVKST
jgi:hypothetical protein